MYFMRTIINLIKILPFIFLCSCAGPSLPNTYKSIQNGCVINAVNFQTVILESKPRWARILVVKYTAANKQNNHALCVFKLDDDVYAYNHGRYIYIKGTGEDPLEVASQLYENIILAHYE